MGGTQVLIFGTDELYDELAPFYKEATRKGTIAIIAYGVIRDGNVSFYRTYDEHGGAEPLSIGELSCQAAILSAHINFFLYRKMLLDYGVPESLIIDGRAFRVPGLQFPLLCQEGIAQGVVNDCNFCDYSFTVHPRRYLHDKQRFYIEMGRKSYISPYAHIDGYGLIYIRHYTAIAREVTFELQITNGHNYHQVSNLDPIVWDRELPENFSAAPSVDCSIHIGSDVWIGVGCILKATNPNRPLSVGDGAVIAADSVVVTDVPPYAIVGGNPAKLIKYRFPRDIIDKLLRIQWWNWPIEKIHEALPLFPNPVDFAKRYG